MSAIESKNIDCFPTWFYEQEVIFWDDIIKLKDDSLYLGQTLLDEETPHGFGVEITRSWKIIRVGYYYEGLKHGYFNTFGMANDQPYSNRGFYEFGL